MNQDVLAMLIFYILCVPVLMMGQSVNIFRNWLLCLYELANLHVGFPVLLFYSLCCIYLDYNFVAVYLSVRQQYL